MNERKTILGATEKIGMCDTFAFDPKLYMKYRVVWASIALIICRGDHTGLKFDTLA